MKLKRLKISDYKNIRACDVEFTSSHVLYAVIGSNGSGKSNLIEGILQILIGFYFEKPPAFEFHLEFDAQNRCIVLQRQDGRISVLVDGERVSIDHFARRLRDGPAQVFYPELTLVYYSGECRRTKRLVTRYRRNYEKQVRQPDSDRLRPLFIQTSNEQSQVILLALFAHKKLSLLDRLNLQSIEDVSIVLRSPEGFDPNLHEPKLWNTQGAIRRIVAAIDEISSDQQSRRFQHFDSELFDPEIPSLSLNPQIEERRYHFRDEPRKGIRSLAERLAREGDNVYLALESLRSRGILRRVSFRLRGRNSSGAFDFEQLSEGEKQLLAVIGALTLTNQRDNLVLLDEPDTHLNPHWSWDYPSMLEDAILDHADSAVLMATHDPVIISGMTRDQVLLAHPDGEGFSRPHRNPRGQGVANLLCSPEFFGLPSSLDKETQKLLDERLALSIKPTLFRQDKARLRSLNQQLEILPGVSERDPSYVAFLRAQADDLRG
jgi:energy-coupling factor transporter ATP-binding protein EcfA2